MVFKKGHKINIGRKKSKKQRLNHSKKMKGKNNPMYGKKHSKKIKDKISKSLKGISKPISEKTKKKISKTLLKKHIMKDKSYEELYGNKKGKQLKKIRSIKLKNAYNSGKRERPFGILNPAWNGGISFEPYSPKFNKKLKTLIKERDNYKCLLCNKRKILCVHHINYNKKDCRPENLITLCRSCNSKVNGKRKYWEKYFKNIIKWNI